MAGMRRRRQGALAAHGKTTAFYASLQVANSHCDCQVALVCYSRPVKRDYKIWRLLLRQMCDGTPPPELKSHDEQEVVYNSALLVDGGFVDGEAVRGGSGEYVGAVMLNLTNKGHDLLEKLDAENQTLNRESPMTQPSQQTLSIFISHSAKDEKLAAALVALLRSALNIPADKIRCTSVNGYRLPIGAETESQLRQEVHEAKAFIGLITPSSMASAYVMFELGARWGAHLHLAPLLGAGAGNEYLRGPLGALNALNCEEAAQVHQLISDLANHLGVRDATKPAVYQDFISKLVEISKSELPPQKPGEPSNPPADAPDAFARGELPEISTEEIELLKQFSKTDRGHDKGYLMHYAEDVLRLHRLKADQLLSRLVKRNLLNQVVRMGMPMSYRLASGGRDYLIEHKLL
jgi:hypothetical protein